MINTLKKRKKIFLKLSILLLIPLFAGSSTVSQEFFIGDIYLAGTNKGLFLFQQKNDILKKDNKLILRHTYTHPDGEIAVQEDVVYENGNFIKYIVEFRGTECGCVLDRNGNKLTFSFTRGDTDKKGQTDYTSELVMGPTLNSFVYKNWENLVQDKTVYFYLPAMTLQRIARFRLYKNTNSPWNRPGVVVYKMDMANMFLRYFVDPVDLVYDASSKRLLEIHGKSLLQRKVNGKIENPVVDIYYRYKN